MKTLPRILAAALAAALPAVQPAFAAADAGNASASVVNLARPPEVTAALTAEQVGAFADSLHRSQLDAGAPGLALAVVQPGHALLLQAWGLRAAGGNATVTPDTRFALGAATQALNSLLVARLADERVLDLDAPARRCWDDFRLADADATKVVCLRDLLLMTAGIPDYTDKVLRPPHDTPPDLFTALAELPVLAQPGVGFSYSEASAAAAGYLAVMAAKDLHGPEAGLPAAYGGVARTQLFEPLGMKSAVFGADMAAPAGDDAVGHAPGPGGVWVPQTPDASAGGALLPAEGLRASARDVAAWLELELSGGLAPNGARLLGEDAVRERWRPEKVWDTRQYGMGWERQYYRGLELVTQHGSRDHQGSLLIIVPQYRTAAVVLVNIGGHPADVFLQDAMLNFADWLRETAGTK